MLKFSIPELILTKLKTITLDGNIGGTALSPETYTQPGEFTYQRDVPANVLAARCREGGFPSR